MLLKLLLILCLADYGETTCPESNETGPLRYTDGMNSADFMIAGHQKSLRCCITGFTRLIWSFRATENDTWQHINGTDYQLDENNRNQTLMILPKQDSDPRPGSYRCTATNAENHTLIHRIELYLGGPTGREHPQAFGPSSTPCAKLGGTISLNCSGDFGQLDSMLRNVEWYYDDGGNLTLLSDLNDSRITSSINNQMAEPSSSQLVIRNVTEADIDKTFRCYVSSVKTEYNKHFKFVVELCPTFVQMTPVDKIKVGGITAGASVVFLLLILLATFMVYLHKPQIEYKLRGKLQGLCERKGNWIPLPNDEPHLYDAMLFHCDVSRDCDIGTSLKSDLKDADFNVVTQEADDADADNLTINSIIEDLVRKSAALVVVYPSDGSDEGSMARLEFILTLIDSIHIYNVTVIRHTNEKNEVNPRLKGYKHLTYEPEDDNRTPHRKFLCALCNNRRRLRKNFLCALKLRILAAKNRRKKRMQQEDLHGRQEGLV
ncbi:uncharacterized protein LOC110448482 [Mizuhopecten yessoensis]|nr:uncharacterized protein LOC110448482 [Mizuhopecten yessoensis]XP_021350419.1 uncharacterized protein LOC110448482 [Mizuhopecten yessoensis]